MVIINGYVFLLMCIFLTSGDCTNGSKRQRTWSTYRQDIVSNCQQNETFLSNIIRACVDLKRLRTLWTQHTIMNSTVIPEDHEPNYCRDNFKQGYSKVDVKNMDYLYYYERWDRGHLAPYADFRSSDAAISCDYMNMVPQYPKLNMGAWRELERSVRKIQNATVFTGTLFNSGLDANVKFLGKNQSEGVVPVPHFLYKLVINGSKAVAFVGINDFETLCNFYTIKKFCSRDMCPGFSNSWSDSRIKPIYCCDAEEFLQNVEESERPIKIRSFDFLNIVNDTKHHRIEGFKFEKEMNFCRDKLIPDPTICRSFSMFSISQGRLFRFSC